MNTLSIWSYILWLSITILRNFVNVWAQMLSISLIAQYYNLYTVVHSMLAKDFYLIISSDESTTNYYKLYII